MNMILTYLHDNWDRLHLDQVSPTQQLSTVMITPRFRASSHVVCLFMPWGRPEPVLVAKVPRLAGPSASVSREVANLRAVQASRPAGFTSIPHIIAFDEYASRQFLLETALVGKPMDPPAVRSEPKRCCEAVITWLGDLHEATQRPSHTEPDWFENLVAEPIQRFANLFPLTPEEMEWLTETQDLVAPLRKSGLPLVFEHGDLSHPNVMWLGDGQPGVVDWELAAAQGLPGYDMFFFLNYVAFAKHHTRTSGNYLPAFREAFFGETAWAVPYIKSYAQRLPLAAETLAPIFVFTWLRYTISLLGRLDEAPGSSGEIGVETAAWLRQNRYYQLWREAITHTHELRW